MKFNKYISGLISLKRELNDTIDIEIENVMKGRVCSKHLSESLNYKIDHSQAPHGAYKEDEGVQVDESESVHNLFLQLPCEVGKKVFQIAIVGFEHHEPIYEIVEAKVIRYIKDTFHTMIETVDHDNKKTKMVIECVGESIFLTKEAAEEKKKKLERGGQL